MGGAQVSIHYTLPRPITLKLQNPSLQFYYSLTLMCTAFRFFSINILPLCTTLRLDDTPSFAQVSAAILRCWPPRFVRRWKTPSSIIIFTTHNKKVLLICTISIINVNSNSSDIKRLKLLDNSILLKTIGCANTFSCILHPPTILVMRRNTRIHRLHSYNHA